ncbi:MAG: helix-turn-helix domain-containing protein [Elusimicrobiota bacterium]|jgi:excisionase family DNA binding protein
MVALMKEFYTVKELAEVLEVNPRTIDRLIERGELNVHRVGRIKRFRRDDIEAYLKKTRE